jgi:hypothetical protein
VAIVTHLVTRSLVRGLLAGLACSSIASFVTGGQTEVTYWIDRAAWGAGIATRALALFLDLVPVRPLHARAASDNGGSLRVLKKPGFKAIGTETSFAAGRVREIDRSVFTAGPGACDGRGPWFACRTTASSTTGG